MPNKSVWKVFEENLACNNWTCCKIKGGPIKKAEYQWLVPGGVEFVQVLWASDGTYEHVRLDFVILQEPGTGAEPH